MPLSRSAEIHRDPGSISVILADDDTNTRFLLTSLLRQNGCQVMAAKTDGAGLLDAFDHLTQLNIPPQIILLDISMPGLIDGIAALKSIRSKNPAAYVVMISGETDSAVVKEVVAAGASGYIVKPFTLGRIRDMIAQYKQKTGGASA